MLTILGVAIVLLALRDVRHELFHPERTGTLSRIVSRGLWRASRAIGERYRPVLYRAGPAMLIAIGATWLGMVATGSALITLDHLPRDFNINPALPTEAREGPVTAFYVAMGMLTSAGATDITPITATMRLVSALEPVIGLVVITAWITWVLSIYPVLAERRAFTRDVDL